MDYAMKYEQKSFSSRAATEDYRNNHGATFGEKPKTCGWCGGTGWEERDGDGRGLVECPKGCEAGK